MYTALTLLQIEILPELRPNPTLYEDWMLLVFLLVLLNIAYVRIAYQRRMQRLFDSLIRVQILRQVMREELVFSHRASILLFLNFCLLAGLTLYLAFKWLSLPMPLDPGWTSFLIFALGIAVLYYGKLILSRFLRWVLQDSGLIREYLFEVFLINKVAGIFVLPLAVGIAFLNISNIAWLFLAAVILGIALFGYRILQGLILSSAHTVSRVYIILYLCTLEILPLYLLIEAVKRGAI